MEIIISNNTSQSGAARLQAMRPTSVWGRLRQWGGRIVANRRVIRYSLVTFNLLLFLGIAWFALSSSRQSESLSQQGVITQGDGAEPLDQFSAADIAVNAAIATAWPRTTAVINQADSVKAEQTIAPADRTVVAKPQAVATPFKSRKDIKEYVVVAGDTAASIAAKFSVTTDSIIWSNGLRGNTVTAGARLVIPPITGIVYTVQPNDTVDSLAQKYRASKDRIIAFNDIELTGLKSGERILIPDGQQPAPVIVLRPLVGSFGYNGYDPGYCTWYVANRRAAAGRPVPANLGNASTWDNRAAAMGMLVNKTPAVGAAAVTSQSGAGHVAYVEIVNADGSIWISEMNSRGQKSLTDPTPYGGWGVVDWKLVPAGTAASYNYVH